LLLLLVLFPAPAWCDPLWVLQEEWQGQQDRSTKEAQGREDGKGAADRHVVLEVVPAAGS